MKRPLLSVKAEAFGLIQGIDPEWSHYLGVAIEYTDPDKIALDWVNPNPLPKQLRNPSVIAKSGEGDIEYISTQVWLAIDDEGNRKLITPNETSGVMIEQGTGKIIENFIGLPEITPDDTKYLIRMSIRRAVNKDTNESYPETKWTLYSKLKS